MNDSCSQRHSTQKTTLSNQLHDQFLFACNLSRTIPMVAHLSSHQPWLHVWGVSAPPQDPSTQDPRYVLQRRFHQWVSENDGVLQCVEQLEVDFHRWSNQCRRCSCKYHCSWPNLRHRYGSSCWEQPQGIKMSCKWLFEEPTLKAATTEMKFCVAS